jgi:heme exporter protein D
VGGVLMMHIDDLRLLAPYWLHKTEEVRSDKAHWSTNITGDIYGEGWISEMYGYSFGAAEIKLRHLKRSDIMMYPGSSVPSFSPRVLHYGLKFEVGNWHFDKAEWREQDMTNTCWQYFPNPPDELSLFNEPLERAQHNISIGCVKTLNEALHLHHIECGCIPLQAFKNPQNELDINMQGRTQSDEHEEDQKRLTQKIVSDQSLDKDPRLQTKTATMDRALDQSEAILGSIRGNSNLNYHVKQVLKRKTDLLESEVWSNSSSNIPTILMSPKYWKVVLWSLLVSLFLLIISTLFSRRNHISQLKQQKRRENNNNNNNNNKKLLKKYPFGSSSSLYTQRPANTRPATNSSIEISGGQYQGVLLPREGDNNIV